jgi:hypothetical protein
MIKLTQNDGFSKFIASLKGTTTSPIKIDYERFGRMGVEALRQATPKGSGETASGWTYTVTKSPKGAAISWSNTVMVGAVPLAVLIQYGHGTRNGGYVQGQDYINPALRPIFDMLDKEVADALRRL